jgi:dTDP-4-dehydrorhamnose reductase
MTSWPRISATCPSMTATRATARSALSYPSWCLHAGALTAVDACETEIELAYAVNAIGTRNVAEAATAVGAHMLYVSTDYVFDGTSPRPYIEWDRPTRVGLRCLQAGRRAGMPLRGRPSCARRGSAGPTGPTWSRPPCAWPPGRHLALRRRPTRVAHLHGRPGARRSSRSGRTASGRLPRDQRRGHHLVGFRAGRTLEAAGADPERVQAITTAEFDPPRPAPDRPIRSSTTWPCA